MATTKHPARLAIQRKPFNSINQRGKISLLHAKVSTGMHGLRSRTTIARPAGCDCAQMCVASTTDVRQCRVSSSPWACIYGQMAQRWMINQACRHQCCIIAGARRAQCNDHNSGGKLPGRAEQLAAIKPLSQPCILQQQHAVLS